MEHGNPEKEGGKMSDPSDWMMLARYLGDECTESERIEIEQWMLDDGDNRQLVAQLRSIWSAPDESMLDVNVEAMWSELASKTKPRVSIADRVKEVLFPMTESWTFGWSLQPLLRYGFIVLLLISLPMLVYRWGDTFATAKPLISVHIDPGQRTRVLLADGSSVILDAGSTLRHPEEFASNSREVFLDGEGFFEVKGDPYWPFIVHAGSAKIGVIGTKFNVRAWSVDQRIEVAVKEGRVTLNAESADIADGVEIVEGQGSSMSDDGLPTPPTEVALDEKLGWMNNRAVFRNVPLGEVLFHLERWYGLKFELSVADVANERVTIYLKQNSVKDILELVSSLIDMPYEKAGNLVRFIQPSTIKSGDLD